MTIEERKRPQAQGTSWFATVAGAGLLVALGFAVGLVAGTAYEEPELVAEHLAGRTVEVALGPIDEGAEHTPADDVAAAPPPEVPASVEPLPTPLGAGALDEPREVRLPVARPPASAARPAAPGAGFAIQVGAFATEATAQQLARELEERGFPSYVADEGSGARFKVRVGPIASRSQAEKVSGRLKDEHRLPTWIMAGKS
jgi:cell division septation protein DedD